MSVVNPIDLNNPNFLVEQIDQLRELVYSSAREGRSLGAFETDLLKTIVALGSECTNQFLILQGDGDLGESINTDDGVLKRSDEARPRLLRTLFGDHTYFAYVYGRNLNLKIDFRPVDVRMQLPDGKFSPRFEEISQILCCDQSFRSAAETLEAIFGKPISVNSLERINRQCGPLAENFMYELPIPKPEEEGEILVVSGDGKGIPMIRESVDPVPACEKTQYPGNRKMATLATVYTVDPFVRTPQEIVDALFRKKTDTLKVKRPETVGKAVVGYLVRTDEDGNQMPSDIQAFTWAAEQVARRHREGQPIVRLMDGQASLWETAAICLGERTTVDILDIIHVSGYVWSAAKIFHTHREHQEAFAYDRLLRILEGGVGGVISGLRQQATKHGLSKKDAASIEKICGYFEKNRYRMRYDEYLKNGYPIATGVIEGACRHLVMDRFCRTGMRWTNAGSQAMLNVRAVHQADLGKEFHAYRADQELYITRNLRVLLKDYKPLTLIA